MLVRGWQRLGQGKACSLAMRVECYRQRVAREVSTHSSAVAFAWWPSWAKMFNSCGTVWLARFLAGCTAALSLHLHMHSDSCCRGQMQQ